MSKVGPWMSTEIPGTAQERGDKPHRGPSSAIEGTSTVDFDLGTPTFEQLREWEENESPYENLADNDDIRELAYQFVRDNVRLYDDKTIPLQRKWYEINYLLQGQSLRWGAWQDPDHVHSPQLYQMLENLDARITEAILNLNSGTGQWFRAVGREEMDRRQEDSVTGYLDYVLDKNKFRRNLSEYVRTALIYSFMPLKTRWERRYDYRVKRERKQELVNGKIRHTVKKSEEKVCVYDGPVFDLIDPVWFICDTYETDPQEMLFVGDRTRMTYEEIVELGERGVFKNVEELEDQEPMGWAMNQNEWLTRQRSQLFDFDDQYVQNRKNGGPKVFNVVELWGKFDLYNTGQARECVITVANNQTVLRVQENPYDDKHRPYAVARCSKYPFDFHSVGPLDHAVQLSIEIDTHRTLALEGTKLAMCPLVFTDDKENLPESLWGVEPGKVFEVPPNSVEFSKISSPLGDLRNVELHLIEDMQKTTGAIGEYMSAGEQGSMSATEYQGRIQEGAKRIRGYIRSMTDAFTQLLEQLHSLSAQYMTSSTRFRVLGKSGASASIYNEVQPQMFDQEMDFTFAAITNLHIVGQEASALQQFMNGVAILADKVDPGKINWDKLLWRYWEMSGGNQLGQEIVAPPADEVILMQQGDELQMMFQGQTVNVDPRDDHREHLDLLVAVMSNEQWAKVPDTVKELVEAHYVKHVQALAKQEQEEAEKQKAMQARQQMGGEEGGYAGQGSMPKVNLERSMQAQMSGGGGPSGFQPGTTPGTGTAQQVEKPGRMSATTQSAGQAMGQ